MVSIETNIEGNSEYFNYWKRKDGTASGRIFCRKTPLGLKSIFWLVVSRIVRTLPVALDQFFSGLGLPSPTKSAFSMKRALVKSTLFERVGRSMVRDFYRSGPVKKWRGYVPLACDGTRLALPEVDALGDRFGMYHTYQGEDLYPSARASVFQDTLNNITVDACVEAKDTDERHTFEQRFRLASRLTGSKTIMLLDRGYYSYLLLYLMVKEGQKFVMKGRDSSWAREFLRSGRMQSTVSVKPSRDTAVYRNSGWRAEPVKEITLRLVRFNHPGGSADVLLTNLAASERVTAKDIIELYRLRWPAETAYGIYKNDEALELFSSFRADGVLQDFHGAVILFNLASMLAMDSEKADSGTTKPDMNVVIGLIHNICPLLALGPDSHALKKRLGTIATEAKHCTVSIKPGRSFPRIRRRRKTSGKFYRYTNHAISE